MGPRNSSRGARASSRRCVNLSEVLRRGGSDRRMKDTHCRMMSIPGQGIIPREDDDAPRLVLYCGEVALLRNANTCQPRATGAILENQALDRAGTAERRHAKTAPLAATGASRRECPQFQRLARVEYVVGTPARISQLYG